MLNCENVFTAQTQSLMITQQMQNEGEEGHVVEKNNFMYDCLNHFDSQL